MRRYFGTDGVRGPFGGPVINAEFAERLGRAAGRFAREAGCPAGSAVILGRDTRASGTVLEEALASGLAHAGLEPLLAGIVPTPAVSLGVRTAGAALGVMVTASHNPAADNGIKFFGAAGTKLGDEEELRIEWLLGETGGNPSHSASSVWRCFDAATLYEERAAALLPKGSLTGWKIGVDTANGSSCRTTPRVLSRLGAELVLLGASPDGENINEGVGSQHPQRLCTTVRREGARLGLAHDGDADRVVFCDETGSLVDGDEVLTLLALDQISREEGGSRSVVITLQSNLGVDAAVLDAGGKIFRTAIGDRYVIERMLAEGAAFGGESSGHYIFSELSPTGDGLLAALKVIDLMRRKGRPLSALRGALRRFPQATCDLPVVDKRELETLSRLQAARREAELRLNGRGRVLVRYSGTEPKMRLLVEGEDPAVVAGLLESIRVAARADLAAG